MKIALPQPDSSLRHRRLTLRSRVALSMTVLAMLLNIAVMLFVLITIPEVAKIMSPDRSLLSIGIMTLITGLSAYWVAGMALRPVREISQAAHSIYADTLDTRLYVSGPQDELKELAESFNAMLYRLQQAFEQQGRFVANAAHDLRTPLTTLRANHALALPIFRLYHAQISFKLFLYYRYIIFVMPSHIFASVDTDGH